MFILAPLGSFSKEIVMSPAVVLAKIYLFTLWEYLVTSSRKTLFEQALLFLIRVASAKDENNQQGVSYFD